MGKLEEGQRVMARTWTRSSSRRCGEGASGGVERTCWKSVTGRTWDVEQQQKVLGGERGARRGCLTLRNGMGGHERGTAAESARSLGG